MNLAIQKRHEQLERWRQNELDNELNQHLTSQQQSKLSNDIGDNSSNHKIISSSPSAKRRNKKRGANNSNLQVKFSNSTLFLTACANGDINECERLIKDKLVDIDTTTSDGLTGLHEAAICGNSHLVEFLIENGANINCGDNEGWTPLHAAASLGQVKIVQLLLDYGADATLINCDNLLAYDLSRNDQVQSIIAAHLQDADIDFLRSQEERAIQNDIDRWISAGHYDERSHPVTKATVLHVLAAKGNIKMMRQILECPTLRKQIDLEAQDTEGFTPLLAASFWSQSDIVELLIEHGANIFAQANNGYKISSIHLKNYQQAKLSQESPKPGIRGSSSRQQSVESNPADEKETQRRSFTPTIKNLSRSDSTKDKSEPIVDSNPVGVISSSAPKHLRQGQLHKTRSLELNQQNQLQSDDTESSMSSSRSVDALLSRLDSMTERELRKSYKDLVIENEQLKIEIKSYDEKEKQKIQEWIRKERQMQRKISELEEENKQMEQWKQEIQHLKDENSSLIRVVTKLTKQP